MTHIAGENGWKLDAKSRQCIILGYQKGVKGFKLWDPKANKVVISRDVIFFMRKPCQKQGGVTKYSKRKEAGFEKS